MSPFKILRCRYFDERGRPVKPYCARGDHCRFVHPNDTNWPDAKYAADKYNFVNHPTNYNGADRTRPRPRSLSRSTDNRRNTATAALPPQGEAFSRLKVEKDQEDPPIRWEDDRERHRNRERDPPSDPRDRPDGPRPDPASYRTMDRPATREDQRMPERGRADMPRPTWGQPPPHSPTQTRQTAPETPYRSRDVTKDRERATSPPPSSSSSRNPFSTPTERGRDPRETRHLEPSRGPIARRPEPQPHSATQNDKKQIDRIVELFRQLAQTTNDTNQDVAQAESEHHKIKAYTDMSTTLSKISGPATAAVAPVLAELLTSHRRYKDRVAVGYERIGHLWQDVFGALLDGVVPALEAAADDALRRLQRDGAALVSDIIVDAHRRERALVRDAERERMRRERDDADSAPAHKRKSSVPDLRAAAAAGPVYADEPPRAYRAEADDAREKRRRLGSPSMAIDEPPRGRDPEPRALAESRRNAEPGADPNVVRMMQEMKAQMDALMKENSHLKATIQRTTPGAQAPAASRTMRSPSPIESLKYPIEPSEPQRSRRDSLYSYDAPPRPPAASGSFSSASELEAQSRALRPADPSDPRRRPSVGGAGMRPPSGGDYDAPPYGGGHHGGGRY